MTLPLSKMKWRNPFKMSLFQRFQGAKTESRGQNLVTDLSYYCNCSDFRSFNLVFGRRITAYYYEDKSINTISRQFVHETLRLFQLVDIYRGNGPDNDLIRMNFSVFIGKGSSPTGLLRVLLKKWRFFKVVNFDVHETYDDSIEIMLEVKRLGLFSPKRDIKII